MKKRNLFLALVMVMIFTLLSMSAFAADVVAEGTCGGNLTWTLDSEGTLTISGTGAMTNYSNDSKAPWFNSRSSIKSVAIGNSVTRIGDDAFYGCDGLTSVTIGNSVTSIGDYAFSYCTGLTEINYNAKAVTYLTRSSNVFYNAGKAGSGIKVTFGDGVEKIPAYLFKDCSYLTSVTIGNSVTSIGNSAFDNCDGLTSVTIPDSVTSIGYSAFDNCDGLTSVTIPDSVTTIGDSAFSYCRSLTSVTIPDSVTSIGDDVFSYCRSLTSVTIPDSVTSIGIFAFYNCDGLTSVTIPDSVTSIGGSAFDGCDGLTSVTIGNSVTSIGGCAFYNCTGLTEINYNAKAVADLTSRSDVFENAGTAGSGIKVTFGDGVKKIPAYLFYTSNGYRPNISNVSIGSNVTSIGNYAFSRCTGLTSVTIGNSVTSIGYSAFCNCDGLTSVTIPDSVTSIGDYAFYNCTGLTEINYNAKVVTDLTSSSDVFYNAGTAGSGIKVTFGEKVKKVPDYLFSTQFSPYIPIIREIVFVGNAPPTIGSESFDRVTTSAYYPYGNDTWTSEVMKDYGGHITWIPYSDAEAVSVVCNGKTSYVVGDELEKNSISVTIERSDGCIEKYNYASGKITLGEYDMSKSGKQSITVTCKDVTAQLNIYIHDLTSETMPANDYPESSHNYEDNLDKTYTYTADGAYSLDVTFSNETEAETNIDYICVNGTTYTGKELANKTVHINGDTLTVRLVSDGSDGAYGFSIDSIIATYLVHEYTDTVVVPTCTEQGYTTHTCACGESHVDSYVDALGHSFGEWTVTTAPTCTEKGAERRDCSRCEHYETREIEVLGHDYKDTVTDPTCTEQGYTTHTCTVCGDSYVDTYVAALGHKYENGVCVQCGEKDSNEQPTIEFVDVPQKAWYVDAVNYAVRNSLMNGVGNDQFNPEGSMTRAMLVTVLWRYEGEPEAGKNTFSDVPNGQWYTNAVAWAAANNIVGGVGNNRFDPDGKITREQMATILFRYAEKKGIDTSKRGDLSSFPDANKISAYAKEAIQWAVAEGIINGSDGKLLPQGNATRAQVATILMRFFENIVNK